LLTVDGVTRRDVGTPAQTEPVKSLYSDAFKRAGVRFGIGASLYAMPVIELKVSDGHLRKDRDKLTMTTAGLDRCRDLYARWLKGDGRVFGEPLDHGDVADSVGDVDALPGDEEAAGIGPDIAKKMVERAWRTGDARSSLQLAASHVAGYDVGDCSTKAKAVEALAHLDFGQAERVDRWIGQKAADTDA
jgi:hypothetical protein